MAPEVRFTFSRPSGPLASFVEYFYVNRVPALFMNRVEAMRLPEAEAQIVFAVEEGFALPAGVPLGAGRQACLFCQTAHLEMFPIPGTIRGAVGAALKATGLRIAIPKVGGDLLKTPLIPLTELWGAEATELLEKMALAPSNLVRAQLLRACLVRRLERVEASSRAVARAIGSIRDSHGELSTEKLAESIGCSSRTLRSLVQAETGLSPKHLARVARIRHALDLVAERGVPLSNAAIAGAFSDQAHMSREFRELLGEPPSKLGQRLDPERLPSFTTDQQLMSTGLLVLPNDECGRAATAPPRYRPQS